MVEELVGLQVLAATDLVAEAIPEVVRHQIGSDADPGTQECRRFLLEFSSHLNRDVAMFGHLWLGVFVDDALVGALHASPKIGEAAIYLAAMRARRSDAPGPGWMEKFLNTVISVDEVAVREEYRRMGIASALIRGLHHRAARHASGFAPANGHPCETSIVTYAGSVEAQSLFEHHGYIVGAPRSPIPAEYMCGAITLWDPNLNSREGSYCFNHLSQL